MFLERLVLYPVNGKYIHFVLSDQNISVNRYHLAFVFDIQTMQQKIYINGGLDASRTTKNAYLGTFGNTTIAYNSYLPASMKFSGKLLR